MNSEANCCAENSHDSIQHTHTHKYIFTINEKQRAIRRKHLGDNKLLRYLRDDNKLLRHLRDDNKLLRYLRDGRFVYLCSSAAISNTCQCPQTHTHTHTHTHTPHTHTHTHTLSLSLSLKQSGTHVHAAKRFCPDIISRHFGLQVCTTSAAKPTHKHKEKTQETAYKHKDTPTHADSEL